MDTKISRQKVWWKIGYMHSLKLFVYSYLLVLKGNRVITVEKADMQS